MLPRSLTVELSHNGKKIKQWVSWNAFHKTNVKISSSTVLKIWYGIMMLTCLECIFTHKPDKRFWYSYKRSSGLPGIPVTSQIVAASRRECSRTQEEVASPRWIHMSSKHLILLGDVLGKQHSISFLWGKTMSIL